MAMSAKVLWIIGGVLAAGVTTAVVVEATKKPASLGPTTNVTLTQGHRYRISFQCSSSGAAPSISALSGVTVVATDPMGNGGSIIVDYAGTTGSYPINNSGCSITVTDMGPSPGPVAVKINKGIPVQNGKGPASQSLVLTTGSTGSAQAVAGGSLAVTTQFQATSIVATPTGPTGPLASSFYGGNDSSIILTGNPGTITIYGPSPSSPAFQAPSVNVQVS